MYRQIGDGKALPFQFLHGAEHGGMLKSRGNQVALALARHDPGGGFDGPVIGFRAAGGEENFVVLRPQAPGDLFPGFLQRAFCPPAQGIGRGRVAVGFLEEGQHGFQNPGREGGGSGVVRIDGFHKRSSFQKKAVEF